MMKKCKIIILVFLFVLIIPMFTGCAIGYSQERIIGVTLSCYAIPGGYQTDPHLAYAKAIETDDYGRTLYAIEITAGYNVKALCIAQKSDENFVYYYDNICYRYTTAFNQYSIDDIENLKMNNDWNKPLTEEKMIKKELNDNDLRPKMNYGNMLDKEYVLNTFIKYVSVPHGCQADVLICDKSSTGQELYIAFILEKVDKSNNIEWLRTNSYFMVFNSDGSFTKDTFLSEITDFDNNNVQLSEFKENNNWM